MIVKVNAEQSKASEKMSIAFNNILENIMHQAVKDKTDYIEEQYNSKFKKDIENVTIINDEPQHGEQTFIKKHISVLTQKDVYGAEGHFTIAAKTHDELITLRSQDLGTGDRISNEVLEEFDITPNKKNITKWYMNPNYGITNFKKFLKKK